MHSSHELRSSSFAIEVAGRPARLEDLFEGFGEHDRLGLVMSRPCGAVGASALICATVTAFYDIQRARGSDFFIYPDYFLFHVGGPLGDHGQLDIWPRRKEVVVGEEPEAILEAIDDRGITRLVVEDGPPGEPEFEREALASARARVATCLAYSASGRVDDGDVRIASNPVTEGYVEAILDPEALLAKLRAEDGDDDRYADAVAARADEVAPELRQEIKLARRALAEERPKARAHRALAEESPKARAHRALAEERPKARAHRALAEERPKARAHRALAEERPKARAHRALAEDVPVETYRRIGLDDALARLG